MENSNVLINRPNTIRVVAVQHNKIKKAVTMAISLS